VVSKRVQVPGPYFMPQPFLNFPLKAFPSQRSCTSLEATDSLAVIHRVCRSAPPAVLSPRFSPTPTFKRSRLVPTETMSSLFTRPKPRFPVALDHQRRDHSLPPASSASKRSSLRESVRPNPSCPELNAVALLGFFPSEDQTFQALEPLTHPAPRD
jgi:hypothetical protein